MTVVGIATFGGRTAWPATVAVLFSAAHGRSSCSASAAGSTASRRWPTAPGVGQAELAPARRCRAARPGTEAVTGAALRRGERKRSNEDVDVLQHRSCWSFAGVALLVGAFIINNTFSILVAQRTRELALLRAIGASARQVRAVGRRSRRSSSASVASALGLVAGVGVARGIKALWSALGIDHAGRAAGRHPVARW